VWLKEVIPPMFQEASSMADMAKEEALRFVCVEGGEEETHQTEV
jgi:D-hexose-6-phosphate mutarotase